MHVNTNILDAEPERYPDILTSADPTYKRFTFDPTTKPDCKNQELIQQGYFWVERIKMEDVKKIQLKVVLEKGDQTDLSELTGGLGDCDWVITKKSSRKCGLAQTLFEECFQDEDVIKNGGVDPKTNPDFVNHKDQQRRAEKNCDIAIVYVSCQPDFPTPKDACKAYLYAALNVGYGWIFTVKKLEKEKTRMDNMILDTAIKKFEKSADDFIQEHGWDWYFCKGKKK